MSGPPADLARRPLARREVLRRLPAATVSGLRGHDLMLYSAGVTFYASLGNHDARTQRDYKLFNMGGKLYYSFKAPKEPVRFFQSRRSAFMNGPTTDGVGTESLNSTSRGAIRDP